MEVRKGRSHWGDWGISQRRGYPGGDPCSELLGMGNEERRSTGRRRNRRRSRRDRGGNADG